MDPGPESRGSQGSESVHVLSQGQRQWNEMTGQLLLAQTACPLRPGPGDCNSSIGGWVSCFGCLKGGSK